MLHEIDFVLFAQSFAGGIFHDLFSFRTVPTYPGVIYPGYMSMSTVLTAGVHPIVPPGWTIVYPGVWYGFSTLSWSFSRRKIRR